MNITEKARAAKLARITDACDLARANLASRATLRYHSLRAVAYGFVTQAQQAEIMRVSRDMGTDDGWGELWSLLVYAATPAKAAPSAVASVNADAEFARAAYFARAALTTPSPVAAYSHHVNARQSWAALCAPASPSETLRAAVLVLAEVTRLETAMSAADDMNAAMGCGFDQGRDQESDHSDMQKIARSHGFDSVEQAMTVAINGIGERKVIRHYAAACEYSGAAGNFAHAWSARYVDCLMGAAISE